MPQPHLEVVGIVRRRDLHRARSEIRFHIRIGDQRDLLVHDGQNQRFAEQFCVAFVLRVDRHGGIAQHRFGAGSRHRYEFIRSLNGVFDIPKGRNLFRILHFGVGKRGLAFGAPVDDARPAVDQTLFIEIDENFPHGAGTALVHGEGEFAPIAGRTEAF